MGKKEKQQLIGLWESLPPEGKSSLLDFAEFLAQKSSACVADNESAAGEKLQPVIIPRPDTENVINALKRLRISYSMLNTDGLLNEASTLMTQFMVHGRDSVSVIDDLEALFESHYQRYLENHD